MNLKIFSFEMFFDLFSASIYNFKMLKMLHVCRFSSKCRIMPLHCTRLMSGKQIQRADILTEGILSGNRASLSQAITLVESQNTVKREMAKLILHKLLTKRYSSNEEPGYHIGLSGPPGAGKSTFIESMGQRIISSEGKLAVLAVDPSSSRTGGSLLGDKTRMQTLANSEDAFIRPSPSRCELGGVTRSTCESALLLEAAGYKNILIETVGVGQSEYAVADMIDIFVLIIPPAAGDELQAIKRGIIELADIIVVNKADGDLLAPARRVAAEYTSALKFIPRKNKCWRPRVALISSLNGNGLEDLWNLITEFKASMIESGEFFKKRKEQREIQMWRHIEYKLLKQFQHNSNVTTHLKDVKTLLAENQITPGQAADDLLQLVSK